MDISEKVIEAIKKAMSTDRVVITALEYSVMNSTDMGGTEDRSNWTQIDVDAVVGKECRGMHFQILWDGKKIRDVAGCSLSPYRYLISQFKREYNEFKLGKMSKKEIFALLVKANRRRKSAERKVRKLRKLLLDVWNNRNKTVESRQRTIEGQWEVMHELQRRGLVSTEDLEKVLWDVMKVRRPRFGNV